MAGHIRVLIVDDSALMRRKIREILESDPRIEVVAAARNGQDAVELVHQHQPDVVTLDINMPVMDGVTALQIIMAESPRPVVMLSSLTQKGALTTLECLELGAVDFVGKPSGTISVDLEVQAREIVDKVVGAARSRPRPRVGSAPPTAGPEPPRPRTRRRRPPARMTAGAGGSARPARTLVAIGCSTGGPKTIMEIVPRLPAELPAAVAIVQHMPESFTASFASRIDGESALSVKEAESGEVLLEGHGYVARGGSHLVFGRRAMGTGFLARYTAEPSDALHIPSVDVMFDSAADTFGDRVVGVLLTGMGADGADGMVKIRRLGGRTIAEDESTCVVFGMPARAIERGGAEKVLPCHAIADAVVEILEGEGSG